MYIYILQDILSRASNGIVMHGSTGDRGLDNQQSTVLEFIPQHRTSTQNTTQLNPTSIQCMSYLSLYLSDILELEYAFVTITKTSLLYIRT